MKQKISICITKTLLCSHYLNNNWTYLTETSLWNSSQEQSS